MPSFFARYNPDALSSRVDVAGVDKIKSNPIIKRKNNGGITAQEVAKHSTKEDCWLIINSKAYDISNWVQKHPGGDIIMSYAGMDATDVFDAFHDPSSHKLLSGFYIGDVIDIQVSETLKEHRNMKLKLEKENMFDASMLYYAYKFLTNISILSLSIFVAFSSPQYGE